MHRKQLLELLNDYSPSLEETGIKERIIDFVEENENCFERSLEIGHITASSWLLNKTGSKALLMHHAKLNKWVQLGGHCDGNPDVLAVAIKEAQEESGIVQIAPLSKAVFDIDIHPISENSKEKAHYHYDIRFLLQSTEDDRFTSNEESKELRWISQDIDSLPTQQPSVVRLFHKWLQLGASSLLRV